MVQKKKKSIAEEIALFTSHLESLCSTLPFTMFTLNKVGQKFDQDLDKFIEANCEIKDKEESSKLIAVKREHYSDWKKKSFNRNNFSMACKLVPRSFLVAMLSQYDAYLGRLLKAIYNLRPEIFNQSEKNYSFGEISEFESIDDFREHAIEKEVESFLRESHAEHFCKMESKFKLTLTKELDLWPTFIELTERRNLFVHTDGIVSKQYLLVCRKHNVDLKNIKEGDVLGAPYDYFIDAYNCLYELGVKLGQVLWRKIFPEDIENADKSLADTTYDLIERGEYDLACKIIDLALKHWKFSTDYRKSIIIVNCAQAHKWAGRIEECKKIMGNTDWSAKSDEFKMANAVLIEGWDSSTNLMLRIGKNSELISEIDYRDWPLFKEFRKQESFLNTYKKVFGKDFVEKVENESEDNKKIQQVA